MKSKHSPPSQLELQGIVIPYQWNQNNEVIAVALSSQEEKDYVILSEEQGADLFGMLQRNVKVRGTLMDQNGVECLLVSQIEEIPW